MMYRALVTVMLIAGCSPRVDRMAHSFVTPTAPLSSVEWAGDKPSADNETIARYTEHFRLLAFYGELSGRHNPWITKVNLSSIAYCVKPGGRYRQAAINTIRKMEVLTGIRIRQADGENCAFSIRDGNYQGLNGCVGHARITNSGEVVSADVLVPKGDRDIDGCMEEEISQSLALRNDLTGSFETIYNDATNDTHRFLTWHDAILIRVLYNPLLRPGMPEAEAMKIVPGLIRQNLKDIQ